MMSVWSSLVGQDDAVAKLSEAAASARAIVASRAGSAALEDARSMSHAWLITGPPGSGRSVAARAFAALTQEGINILMISTSEIKITILIQEKYVELAVRILHDTFGLDWDIG